MSFILGKSLVYLYLSANDFFSLGGKIEVRIFASLTLGQILYFLVPDLHRIPTYDLKTVQSNGNSSLDLFIFLQTIEARFMLDV